MAKTVIDNPSPIFTLHPTGVFRIPLDGEYYRYINSPIDVWHECTGVDADGCDDGCNPGRERGSFRGCNPQDFEIYEVSIEFPKGSRKTNHGSTQKTNQRSAGH